jgi:hypothetical protein
MPDSFHAPSSAPRRPGRPAARILVTLVAAIFVAGCSVSNPSPSPSPSAQPTGGLVGPSAIPTASPSPAPSLSPAELEALIAETEASVPPIRQLEPTNKVPDRIVDEAGLRVDLERFIAEAATPEEYAVQARLGERLGFFPPGTDLAATQLDLLGDQVLGYYDDKRDEMAVVQRGGAFGPLERVTLAHEYTHALQDQHFDLGSLDREDLSNGDRSLARTALVEGDASLLTQQWSLANMTFAEILAITKQALDPASMAVLSRVPPHVARQLTFPYQEGLQFASGLFGQGGWAAVDAAFASPPDSTEQVLHPEKYTSREKPVKVAAPIVAKNLGRRWSEATQDTIGELGAAVWLEPTAGKRAAADAASGWGGDRVVLLEGPKDAWLVAWRTAWDTPADADAFAAAAEAQAATLANPATVTHAPGSSDVEVRIASASELLRAPAGS